jgi:hypothetical protein
MVSYTPTAEAIVRYVEAKALIGGTTTGQGIRSKSGAKSTPKMYHGAMRNVEETQDKRLPEAGTKIIDLDGGDADEVEGFRRALKKNAAYFYHLSEGADETARKHFVALQTNNLLQSSLVGVHALALTAADLAALGAAKAKVVWSPYSNRLLYESTIDLQALRSSGATFSIGCDWTPTGSKNLLLELKVARFMAGKQPAAGLQSEQLVAAVTRDAARVAGWGEYLGHIRPGALADLVVIDGTDGDPYDHLIDATERDVALVVIHGVARYGDVSLFEKVHADPAHPAEALTIAGRKKLLHTFTPGSQINHVSLATARKRLEDAMGDLPAFQQRVQNAQNGLQLLGAEESFTLLLDNDMGDAGAPDVELFADVDLPESLELDPLEVNAGTYWDRVEKQKNLPDDLKTELKNAYTG